MNEYIGELTLDLDCRKTMPTIAAGQYDKGRKYLIHITANGNAFSAVGSTVILQGIRCDKSHFSSSCQTDANGNVIIVLSDEILSVKGFAYAKLVLSDSTKNYSTQVFVIDVDGSYEGDITEGDCSLLNDLLNKLMTLFELDSPNLSLSQFTKQAAVQDVVEGIEPVHPSVDVAIENDVVYRYFGGYGNNWRGWVLFSGSKNFVSARVSQIWFETTGTIYIRTGTANSGTVDWTTGEGWQALPTLSRLNDIVNSAATNKFNIAVAYNKDKATLQDGQIHIDDAVANDTIYLIKNSSGTTVGKLFSAGVDGNYYKRIQLRLLGGGNPEISCRIIEYQANPEDPPTVGSWTKLAYASDIPDVSGKEDKSNKASAITSANKGSTTDYPNVKATVDYIDAVVAAISTLSFEVVQTKPTQNIKTNVIYLIPKVAPETNNVYEEWIYINNDWELLGTTSINLSAKEDKTNKVSSFGVGEVDDVHYPTTRAVQRLLNSSVPTKTSDLTNDSGFLTAHQDVSGKEDKSNKSDNFDFNLTPTTAERSKYPTVARMKELLAGTYYDMDEIDNMIGNIESLLSQV